MKMDGLMIWNRSSFWAKMDGLGPKRKALGLKLDGTLLSETIHFKFLRPSSFLNICFQLFNGFFKDGPLSSLTLHFQHPIGVQTVCGRRPYRRIKTEKITFFLSSMSLVWTYTVMVPFLRGNTYQRENCILKGVSGVPTECQNHTYFQNMNLNRGVSIF